MAIEIEVSGTKAIVSNGVWESSDRELQAVLTAVCQHELQKEGYIPDIDSFFGQVAKEKLGAVVNREELPDEDYPPDALF
jgi:hypothetical protein